MIRRRYMGGVKKLPYDAEVEYLKGDNKAYIDTGLYLNGQISVDCVFSITAVAASYLIYGARTGYQNTSFSLFTGVSGKIYSEYNNRGYNSSFSYTVNSIYEVERNGNVVIYKDANGNILDTCTFTTASFITPYTCTLFALHQSSVLTTNNATIKIYSFKVYNNNELVMDMIPVRVGLVGYMYDKVSRKLFGNEGAGAFIVGPDIKRYDENSYIQDGLVFQLDGINKGATDGTWVDLIGGMVFTQADGTVTPVSNGWYFDGTSRMTNASIINYGENTTLEVCMSNFMVFHSGSWSDDNVYFYLLGRSIFFLQRESPVIVDNNSTLLKSPFTASFNLDQCHINKVLYNQYGGVNYFSDPNRTDIGYYRNQYTTGTVYAIRIYNRRLTAQEQLANQDVDMKRFGI